MAIEGILISTAEVADAAVKIGNINKDLEARLMEIKSDMNRLVDSSWKSDAANAIRTNFNSKEKKFLDYKAVVDSYALFLTETAKNYEETETRINSNAEAFK